MIAGLDTRGRVYLSLMQSNSNAKTMAAFFLALAKRLDRERDGWREDTVVLLDNARYHSCKATLRVFEEQQIPVLFTGPHSYNAAPCELLFAAFKNADINPRHVKTGKG